MPSPNSTFKTQRNDSKTDPIATAVTTGFARRRPNRPLIAAPASGNAGMSQRRIFLVFKCIHFVDLQRIAILENCQDDAQSDRGFSSGYNHDEEREDVSIHLPELIRERDETQVH